MVLRALRVFCNFSLYMLLSASLKRLVIIIDEPVPMAEPMDILKGSGGFDECYLSTAS